MKRRIEVYTDSNGPMFCVRVDPPLEGGGTGRKAFGDLANAMAYARLLRLEFGFPITGEIANNVTSFNDARKRRGLPAVGPVAQALRSRPTSVDLLVDGSPRTAA